MQILQNKIIITLLIVIALGISYFVTQDVLEKKAKRDALEKVRIEREIRSRQAKEELKKIKGGLEAYQERREVFEEQRRKKNEASGFKPLNIDSF